MKKAAESVQEIPLSELHPFKNHPFRVVDDEAMQRTVESVARFGVLAPGAGPAPTGRRVRAGFGPPAYAGIRTGRAYNHAGDRPGDGR